MTAKTQIWSVEHAPPCHAPRLRLICSAAPLARSRQRHRWGVLKVCVPAGTLMGKSWHLAVTRLCPPPSIYQGIRDFPSEVQSLMWTYVSSTALMTTENTFQALSCRLYITEQITPEELLWFVAI